MRVSHAVSLTATFVALSVSLYQSGLNRPPIVEAEQTSATRPNVLVILTDDQDVDSLPVMRHLMSYPEGSWVNFTNAFVSVSLCAPARATLLSGQYSEHHRVTTNANGERLNENLLLPVWLDSAGYNTALMGKYHIRVGAKYMPPGWDKRINPKGASDVDAYNQAALNYIQNTTSPWFLLVSYMAPHAVANPPDRYKNTDVNLPPPRPNVNELDVSDKPAWLRQYPLLTSTTLEKWRREQTNAWRETLAIDDGVAAFVAKLKDTGQLNNTLIIFVGDNGMSWGSHRKIGKWCPYEECSRIPLLIRYPGTADNRVDTHLVGMVDLAATIAEYTGVTPQLAQDGHSLVPLLRNADASQWRESVLLERHINDDYFGIRVPGWKYIEYRRGFRELYDLQADPYEMQNVANQARYADIQAQLAQQLQAIRP